MPYVKNMWSLKAFKGKGWPAHPAQHQIVWANQRVVSLGTWASAGVADAA